MDITFDGFVEAGERFVARGGVYDRYMGVIAPRGTTGGRYWTRPQAIFVEDRDYGVRVGYEWLGDTMACRFCGRRLQNMSATPAMCKLCRFGPKRDHG